MKVSWTKGLDKELSIDVTQNYKESLVMRRRLITLLQDKIDASLHEARQKATYENANWALLQADAVGYQRALSDVISLISDGAVNKTP